jgi:hypothetical protein
LRLLNVTPDDLPALDQIELPELRQVEIPPSQQPEGSRG